MIPSNLNTFAFESSRMVIYCREQKKEYPVHKKKNKECYYINIGNQKVTVTPIVKPILNDVMFRYIFEGWIIDFPCIAFHYWYVWSTTQKKPNISTFKTEHKHIKKPTN